MPFYEKKKRMKSTVNIKEETWTKCLEELHAYDAKEINIDTEEVIKERGKELLIALRLRNWEKKLQANKRQEDQKKKI